MGLLSFWTQTITRIRPATKTLRGSAVPDWDHATSRTISGCSVQPASTSLSQDGRVMGITDGLTIYAPADADIQAGDRIVYGGNTYVIDGEPLQWPGAANLGHMHLNVKRWRG